MTLNGWEYGIAVGILALLVPSMLALFGWVVKTAIKNAADAQNKVASAQTDALRANAETFKAYFEELKGITLRLDQAILDMLKERDHVCTTDHTRLIEEMHRLNTHLSELTGMLTFILDHYIKNNGVADGSK